MTSRQLLSLRYCEIDDTVTSLLLTPILTYFVRHSPSLFYFSLVHQSDRDTNHQDTSGCNLGKFNHSPSSRVVAFFIHVVKHCLINIWPVKMRFNQKSKEGISGGSSTWDNKVKMITVPAAANKSHITTAPANRLREALERFGLFVRLKDLFLCLSHVTQIVSLSLCWLWCFCSAESWVQWMI